MFLKRVMLRLLLLFLFWKNETGKTHQIRAHLAYLGFPIVGDGKYGKNDINKSFKKSRQMLCSYKLKFNFSSDSGVLNYLHGREFVLGSVDF